MLKDQFNRVHNYLRISLTDQCNLRCAYCMPAEHYNFMPPQHLMQANEVLQLAQLFCDHGVNKIRLTGGEPFARKDFRAIAQGLAQLPVKLSITSNGTLIHKHLDFLEEIRLRSINISLDTLKAERFLALTKRPLYKQVWSNIERLMERGFDVKLNVVPLREVNADELVDFAELTLKYPLDVRFIEFMPFDGNAWNKQKVFTTQEIRTELEQKWTLVPVESAFQDTAVKFRIPMGKGSIGFISTVTQNFCSGCNRIRLTADGKIRNCLFSKQETDLLSALRAGQDVLPLIQSCIYKKKKELGGLPPLTDLKVDQKTLSERSMIGIGG